MSPDPAAVAGIVSDIARQEILPRFCAIDRERARAKTGPGDLVTEADVQGERALIERLTDLLPGSVAVGEEGCFVNSSLRERIGAEDWVWIVDPLDGTNNFVAGTACFASVVALARRGETVAGWIHDPIAQTTIIAERDGGAFLGETRLKMAGGGPPLSDLAAARRFRLPAGMTLGGERGRMVGSTAHDYMALARGEIFFTAFRRLAPWDHAAGALIVSECGGVCALLDGETYRPTVRGGVLISAADCALWDAAAALF